MATIGDHQAMYQHYQSLILSTNSGGLPLPPFPLKRQTESLSYPSPTAPIAAQIPLISSPSNGENGYDTPSSYSSPPHPSALSINTKSSSIHLDAKFHSFEEFRCTLEEWMNLNFHPFRVASSEMLRESEGTLNEKFRYRYIVYHCAHYGHPRRRGAGKRPNQNYLPCGCTANLRLNYSFPDKCLKITTLKIDHTNHELSAEAFAKCSIKLKKSPSEDTPLPSKKGKKRAASSSTDDSGVGITPLTKRIKGETSSPPSAFSPLHSSTPPSESTNESESPSDKKDEDWTLPPPPPNLPAPTPQRPSTNYNNLLPFLMSQPHLFLGNLTTPFFNFSPQAPLNIMQPSSMEAQFTFKFNESPIATPVDASSEDKENSEFIDVENERASSPHEYATLQPVKSVPSLTQSYESNDLQHTISSLQNQLLNGDPELAAARQAELQSLMSKWGSISPSI